MYTKPLLTILILLSTALAVDKNMQDVDKLTWKDMEPLIREKFREGAKGTIINDSAFSNNDTLINMINHTIHQATYEHEYKEDVFDCSNQSKLLYKYLASAGFRPQIAYTFDERLQQAHSWVEINDNEGGTIAIETTVRRTGLGAIALNGIYYNQPKLVIDSFDALHDWPMID
jgi:hypothetical protein